MFSALWRKPDYTKKYTCPTDQFGQMFERAEVEVLGAHKSPSAAENPTTKPHSHMFDCESAK
jgi:hypothetical protein